MIAVLARPAEREAVQEFFQLWKTPWEFLEPGHRYDVVLSSGETPPASAAALTLIYSSGEETFDRVAGVHVSTHRSATPLAWWGGPLPVLGDIGRFSSGAPPLLVERQTRGTIFYHRFVGDRQAVRIGYDLFREVAALLGSGQPAEHAGCPTLDRHIALARELILAAGVSLAEIPPVPEGHPYLVCLTHDVDHPRLTNHRCDHTMLGFLHRATVGSVVDVLTHRRPPRTLWRNMAAAATLPLVHLGLASDPWSTFDRYTEIEAGLGTTYFLIPVSGQPGRLPTGLAPHRRASGYSLAQLRPALDRVRAGGAELGVHGIDAWLDEKSGTREHRLFQDATGVTARGIRMHWLYFGQQSAAALEAAGYAYDASCGFNETVGYRAGTAQVFRPPGVRALLELPLQIMDTALFYPTYLHLREDEAHRRIGPLLDHARASGGVLTVNWHDRSIAPERCWDRFYLELLQQLRADGAWCATASAAVGWFAQRRSAVFELARGPTGSTRVRVRTDRTPGLPGLILRCHVAESVTGAPFASRPHYTTYDQTCDVTAELEIPA